MVLKTPKFEMQQKAHIFISGLQNLSKQSFKATKKKINK